MKARNSTCLTPLVKMRLFQQADLGMRAGGIGAGAQHVDLSVPQLLVNASTAYNDEIYQNLMAYAAQLQVLGVLAGVIDGPTEEYRAAVAEAAGSYIENVLERSRRQHWTENLSILDGAATLMGWYYQGAGALADVVAPDDSMLDRAGQRMSDVGETLVETDPDRLLFNLTADFLQSIWNACKDRWDEFWDDFGREGLLSAMAQLKADADFLAAEIAIDVALAVVTGGAAAAIRIAARRVSSMASSVVIRAIDAGSNAVPDGRVLREIRVNDADIDDTIRRQVLDEEQLRTASERDRLTADGEVEDPGAERPSGGGAGAVEDVGDTPRTTRLPNNQVRHQMGRNSSVTTYADNGRPISQEGVLRDDFPGRDRRDNATAIGNLAGNRLDDGGHIMGHRFFGDTPDEGIFPQHRNLNRGQYRDLESSFADEIAAGNEVHYTVTLDPPGTIRPDGMIVRYRIVDPETGEIIRRDREAFPNTHRDDPEGIAWRQRNSG